LQTFLTSSMLKSKTLSPQRSMLQRLY